MRLDGRRALVTGGSRGIGLAAAAALGEQGAEVDIVSRDEDNLDKAVAALQEAGVTARGFALDVLDLAALDEMLAGNGPYQVAVINAGTTRLAETAEISEHDYDTVMNLNVKAALFTAKGVVRGLQTEQMEGSLIFISSQMGHVGGPERVAYCASKHAIEGIAKVIAWEYGKQGIRANTICPTFIETELTSAILRERDFLKFVLSNIALGRVGHLEDIMGAVQFLASDAAAMVTGSALMVDGGWTAH